MRVATTLRPTTDSTNESCALATASSVFCDSADSRVSSAAAGAAASSSPVGSVAYDGGFLIVFILT